MDQKTTSRSTSISVAIVNYGTPELTIDSIRSLANERATESFDSLQAIVVDNASPHESDSVDKIAAAIADNGWRDWVTFIPSERNGGFSAGCNIAIKHARASAQPPEFIWLLNPDATVSPGAIQPLVEYVSQHPDVGIVGTRVEGSDTVPQHSAFRFPGVLSELVDAMQFNPVSKLLSNYHVAPPIRDSLHKTDWVSGASMLIRADVFENVGLFDEGYFLYFEEVDFCHRAAKAGWKCWYLPTSRVVHLVGQSTGISDVEKRRPTYWFESRRRYFVKNHSWAYCAVADTVFILGMATRRLRRFLQRRKDDGPRQFFSDFVRNSVWFRPSI